MDLEKSLQYQWEIDGEIPPTGERNHHHNVEERPSRKVNAVIASVFLIGVVGCISAFRVIASDRHAQASANRFFTSWQKEFPSIDPTDFSNLQKRQNNGSTGASTVVVTSTAPPPTSDPPTTSAPPPETSSAPPPTSAAPPPPSSSSSEPAPAPSSSTAAPPASSQAPPPAGSSSAPAAAAVPTSNNAAQPTAAAAPTNNAAAPTATVLPTDGAATTSGTFTYTPSGTRTAGSSSGSTESADASSSSKGSNPKLLGGAIGGAIVFLILLAGIIFFLYRRRKNRPPRPVSQPNYNNNNNNNNNEKPVDFHPPNHEPTIPNVGGTHDNHSSNITAAAVGRKYDTSPPPQNPQAYVRPIPVKGPHPGIMELPTNERHIAELPAQYPTGGHTKDGRYQPHHGPPEGGIAPTGAVNPNHHNSVSPLPTSPGSPGSPPPASPLSHGDRSGATSPLSELEGPAVSPYNTVSGMGRPPQDNVRPHHDYLSTKTYAELDSNAR